MTRRGLMTAAVPVSLLAGLGISVAAMQVLTRPIDIPLLIAGALVAVVGQVLPIALARTVAAREGSRPTLSLRVAGQVLSAVNGVLFVVALWQHVPPLILVCGAVYALSTLLVVLGVLGRPTGERVPASG